MYFTVFGIFGENAVEHECAVSNGEILKKWVTEYFVIWIE